jgi:Flp pilus assembly protein TadG
MRMNHLIRKFVKNGRGNTVVEFALILPILILLVSGIFEICMFALVNNKLMRIAGTISNVVSMQNINISTMQAIIATASDMAKPVTFKGKGNVIVSLIYNNGQTTNPAKMLIAWQQKDSPGVVSLIGTPNTLPKNLPNNLAVLNDETVIITEVLYNYSPYVFNNFIPNQTLYKTAVYVPRLGDMITLLTP